MSIGAFMAAGERSVASIHAIAPMGNAELQAGKSLIRPISVPAQR